MVPNNRKTHTGEYLCHSAKLALVCAGVAEVASALGPGPILSPLTTAVGTPRPESLCPGMYEGVLCQDEIQPAS
jgi:hypothetical protein